MCQRIEPPIGAPTVREGFSPHHKPLPYGRGSDGQRSSLLEGLFPISV